MKALLTLIQPAFDWTWKNSLQVALLVGLVLLVQTVLARWLTPRLRYGLSLLILLRLLLPAVPSSPLSLENLFRPAARLEAHSLASERGRPGEASLPDGLISPMVTEPALVAPTTPLPVVTPFVSAPPSRPPLLSFAEVLGLAWACGVLVLFSLAGWRYGQWCRLIRQGRRLSDPRLLALLDGARQAMEVRRPVTLVAMAQLGSPAIFGFRRVRLLLPEMALDQLTDQDLRLLFLHEMAHVRRHDMLLNLLLMAVQFVHWFNPLLWLGLHRLRADRELVCDAMVLQRARPEERLTYGSLLLKMLTDFPSDQAMIPTAVPVVSSQHELKRRILMIKVHGRTSLPVCVATGIATVVLACLTFTGSSSHPLSVTFLRWSDMPVFPANTPEEFRSMFPKGEYALLGVTNNGTRSLRFDSRAVEYESDGHWVEVIPKQWLGMHGTWWDAGAPGSIVWLTQPSEVPRGVRWRIRYVCAFDVSRDANAALRNRLNQIAAKVLGTNTLAFCAPVTMVTPEIPPANVQDGAANGSQALTNGSVPPEVNVTGMGVVAAALDSAGGAPNSAVPQTTHNLHGHVVPMPTNITYVGVVELSDHTPVRVELGAGKSCVLTPTVLSATNVQIDVVFEELDMRGKVAKFTPPPISGRDGVRAAVSVGDICFAFTPKLSAIPGSSQQPPVAPKSPKGQALNDRSKSSTAAIEKGRESAAVLQALVQAILTGESVGLEKEGLGFKTQPANSQEVMDFDKQIIRWQAATALTKRGTNAWPAVPALLSTATGKDMSVGLAAAEALVGIKAEESPEWARSRQLLVGQTNAARIFRYLLVGRDMSGRIYDGAHRRFGLVGLAATGPAAGIAYPDIVDVLKHDKELEVRACAAMVLGGLEVERKATVVLLKGVLQDKEEWPLVSAAAAKALATAAPAEAETRDLLRQSLQDQRSAVRLAAARALWRMKAPVEEVLPVLTALLNHKLASTRAGALNSLSEMGSAARPSVSEVQRLTGDENESVRRAAAEALTNITKRAQGDATSGSLAASAHPAIHLVEAGTLTTWGNGRVLYVGKREGNSLKDVHILDKIPNGQSRTVRAETGILAEGSSQSSVKITLLNGTAETAETKATFQEWTFELGR